MDVPESARYGLPEAPREVFLAACDSIAGALSAEDYRYSRSGCHCRRAAGDFSFKVGFHSSHHNVAGGRVNLSVTATVFSPRIKKWRKAHPPLRDWDYVAGGQVGNLQADHRWIDWELADPSRRGAAIDEAVATIRSLALPYFTRFESPTELRESLARADLPSMDLARTIEFLLCFGDVTDARRAAARFLDSSPGLWPEYERELRRDGGEGVRPLPSGGAPYLAFASRVLGLGILARGES